MLRRGITLSFLSLGLFACGSGVGDDDASAGGDSNAPCVDPGIALDWKLTMPSGNEFRSESRFGNTQPNVPIDISGIVSLDGTKLVIPTTSGSFELSFTRQSAPIDAGIPAGAAVHVTGRLDDAPQMTGGGTRWRLELEIRNDPTGGGVEPGERVFLVAGPWSTPEGAAITVEMDDACQVGDNRYQRSWLVSEGGEPQTVVPEGGSHRVEVSSGTDAGVYEFLGGDATFPLEGDGGSFFLIRRAAE